MKRFVIAFVVMAMAILGGCSLLGGDATAILGDWYMSQYADGSGATTNAPVNFTNGQATGANLTVTETTVAIVWGPSVPLTDTTVTNYTIDAELGTWTGDPIYDSVYPLAYTVDTTTMVWNFDTGAGSFEIYTFTKVQ